MNNGNLIVAHARERFKTAPYRHQEADVASLFDNEVFGLFNEMGTGKTKTVIDAACLLHEWEKINTVLIVCPAAVRSVWVNPEFGEIKKHSWKSSCVLEFHTPSRIIWTDSNAKLDWCVTNYEYIRKSDKRERLIKLLHGRKILMVLDESSFIKNRVAEQTKACMEIGKVVHRKVILNGTPISNNPFDLWSQMNFLSPRILPYKNFYHFRSEFAVMGGFHNHKVIQWQNLDRLQQHVAPYVVRREKKDCLDLPKKIYTQLEVPLSERTWKMYKKMKDEAVVWLEQNPSMAAQAGVKIMRLAQITSGFLGGFLPADDSSQVELEAVEISHEKLDLLRQWIKERLEEKPTRKIIVWCRFRKELERVAQDLNNFCLECGGRRFENHSSSHTFQPLDTYKLYGQGKNERTEAIKRFSTVDDKPAILAAQPQAGGFGLNLIAADTVVYMSNDFSPQNRLQSEDRVHRPGQTQHVLYLDILATGPTGQKTIDHHIRKVLKNKFDIATWTCAGWKKILEEE